jgi:hypothetical protein
MNIRPMTGGEKIAAALYNALIEAPLEEQQELFAALDEYRTKYFRSYDAVRKQPFARKLLGAIDDVAREIDYRMSGEEIA